MDESNEPNLVNMGGGNFVPEIKIDRKILVTDSDYEPMSDAFTLEKEEDKDKDKNKEYDSDRDGLREAAKALARHLPA